MAKKGNDDAIPSKIDLKSKHSWAKPLQNILSQFDSFTPELLHDLGSYVLTGEPVDALLKIQPAAEDKRIKTEARGYNSIFATDPLYKFTKSLFAKSLTQHDHEYYLRLCQLVATLDNSFNRTPFKDQPGDVWAQYFFTFALGENGYNPKSEVVTPPMPLNRILEVLRMGNLSEIQIAEKLVGLRDRNPSLMYSYYHYEVCPATRYNIGQQIFDTFEDQINILINTLPHEPTKQLLELMEELKITNHAFLSNIVERAVGPHKAIRITVLPLLSLFGKQPFDLLAAKLTNGETATREAAAQALFKLFPEEAPNLFERHLETEKSDRVRRIVKNCLSSCNEDIGDDEAIPSVTIDMAEYPVSAETRACIQQAIATLNKDTEAYYQKELARFNSPDRPSWMTNKPKQPQLVGMETEVAICQFLETGVAEKKTDLDNTLRYLFPHFNKSKLASCITPLQLVRLVQGPTKEMMSYNYPNKPDQLSTVFSDWGPREIDFAVCTALGKEPGSLIAEEIRDLTSYSTIFKSVSEEQLAFIFAEHLSGFEAALAGTIPSKNSWDDGSNRRGEILRLMARLPKIPSRLQPILWTLALGDKKKERLLARAAMRTIPNKTETVIQSLADGKQELRQTAADWLAVMKDSAAVPALEAAFAKEKSEIVKGALLVALENCGADVNRYLDRNQLEQDAKKNLAKKVPAALDWFLFDSLPVVRWADSQQPIAPEIIKWWIVQCVQLKVSTPGPLLRRYLAMAVQTDVRDLGSYILHSWIAQDTRTLSSTEAQEKAAKQAAADWKAYSGYSWFLSQYGSQEAYQKTLFSKYTTECTGSASDSRGMLAITATAGSSDVVKSTEKYIRQWFGQRLAQCKALVEMLSQIKHPLALQVLLSLANRFRTKAIRDLAMGFVQAIADREGWTIDELADRTIPDAGFARPVDEAGKPIGSTATMSLNYGARSFTAQLSDALEPIVVNEDGKIVKALPNPAKNDDPEKAKEAKKSFSDAKKQVKEIVKRQSERFYEGMCTQRSWLASDWRLYLADHPIVGRLCSRLIWQAQRGTDDNTIRFCFRLLEDGSLTNSSDETVTLDSADRITLAHSALLTPEEDTAWAQHLTDYDVTPLFAQTGRVGVTLTAEEKTQSEWKVFEGHMISTFKLRGKANKLGYVRSNAEDGGCFYSYRKPFPSLSLQSVISFTGSMLPETDIPAALTTLTFVPMTPEDESVYVYRQKDFTLGEVPPVLLIEAYNDIAQIAKEGSGFDAAWEQKAGF